MTTFAFIYLLSLIVVVLSDRARAFIPISSTAGGD